MQIPLAICQTTTDRNCWEKHSFSKCERQKDYIKVHFASKNCCTDVNVNWFRKPVKQKDLEGKDYRWDYSAKGLFVGMKLTLVLEYPSLKFTVLTASCKQA